LGTYATEDSIFTVENEETIKAVAATGFLGAFYAITARYDTHRKCVAKVEQKL